MLWSNYYSRVDGLLPPFQSWMKSTQEENRFARNNIGKSSQEVEEEKWELQITMDYMLYFQRLVNKYKYVDPSETQKWPH